jgi:hypothetical protein
MLVVMFFYEMRAGQGLRGNNETTTNSPKKLINSDISRVYRPSVFWDAKKDP